MTAKLSGVYCCPCGVETEYAWGDLNVGCVMQCLACKAVYGHVRPQRGGSAWVLIRPQDVMFHGLLEKFDEPDEEAVDSAKDDDAPEPTLPDKYFRRRLAAAREQCAANLEKAAFYAYCLLTDPGQIPWSVLADAEKQIWRDAVQDGNPFDVERADAERAERRKELDRRISALSGRA